MRWYDGIWIAVVIVGIWLLYDNGYLVAQSKRALTFIGSGIGTAKYFQFQFTGCTGFASRVLRVQESGSYSFDLDAVLSKGTVRFTVLDAKKNPLLTLTPEQNRGNAILENGQRYHIRMDFDHASGTTKASWENN